MGQSASQLVVKHKQTADLFAFKGHYQMALQNYQDALQLYLKSAKSDTSQVADFLIQIGSTYLKLSQYEEALKCFEKSLEIYSKIFGENDSHIIMACDKIGWTYQKMS